MSPIDVRALLEARKKKSSLKDAISKSGISGSELSELERFVAEDVHCLRADITIFDGEALVSRYTFIEREFGSDVWIGW